MKTKSTTICIANHKGGVGKTTTAVTLATGLAGLGHNVILVDTDPQGHCGEFLNIQPNGTPSTLFNALLTEDAELLRYNNNLELLLGDKRTVDVETLMRSNGSVNVYSLQNLAANLRALYDDGVIIIVDTAPTLGTVQLASLIASDWLIVPTSPEYAAEIGVVALASTVHELRQSGYGIDLLGVLPTMVDSRSNEHKELIQQLKDHFPDLVLPSVRRLIALAEAPRSGRPIWEYNQYAAADYAGVLGDVVSRLKL